MNLGLMHSILYTFFINIVKLFNLIVVFRNLILRREMMCYNASYRKWTITKFCSLHSK